MSEKTEELETKYYEILQTPNTIEMAKKLVEFITTNFNFASKHSQYLLSICQSLINRNDPNDLPGMLYGMLSNAFDKLIEEYKIKEN
jgi:hypothetical protein